MVDKYFINKIWVVTYQRNKYSEIQTLYEGKSEKIAQKTYKTFINLWD